MDSSSIAVVIIAPSIIKKYNITPYHPLE